MTDDGSAVVTVSCADCTWTSSSTMPDGEWAVVVADQERALRDHRGVVHA